MAVVKAPGLNIIEKPHWKSNHEEAGFVLWIRVIDGDILHAWIECKEDVVLDFLDSELLRSVLNETGLIDKPFYLIWNLKSIVDVSYSYKREITDFLFNWKPALAMVGFFNIPPSLRIVTESFAAIAPEGLHVTLTETFEESMHHVMAFKAGEVTLEVDENEEEREEREVNARFLEAVARISWLDMLEGHRTLPSVDKHYYAFFKAVDSMRRDLAEKKKEENIEFKQRTNDFKHRITQMTIKMNAQAELTKKSSTDFEKEIAALRTRIATQDMELTRVSTAIAEKTSSLRNLLDQIHALEIDTSVKRQMTDSCLSLIETETIEKRLNIELTESDSVFLSKLQKKHPNLNQRELRISLLVKLNYDTKEIARSVGISTRGMESIRYRMHKKLNLGKHQSIKTYLSDFAVAY
jgi:DNA-binding CsgD family transcriptional regulator